MFRQWDRNLREDALQTMVNGLSNDMETQRKQLTTEKQEREDALQMMMTELKSDLEVNQSKLTNMNEAALEQVENGLMADAMKADMELQSEIATLQSDLGCANSSKPVPSLKLGVHCVELQLSSLLEDMKVELNEAQHERAKGNKLIKELHNKLAASVSKQRRLEGQVEVLMHELVESQQMVRTLKACNQKRANLHQFAMHKR